MKRKHIILIVAAVFLLQTIAWTIWGNVTVGLTSLEVKEKNLPAVFDGYRVAHVSDLHNSWLWEKAIDQLRNAQPDMICMTGDWIDSDDVENAFRFVETAVQIAPCYFVPGNHEMMVSQETYVRFMQGLEDRGVIVLLDQSVMISRDDSQICLTGHRCTDTTDIGSLTEFDGYNLLLSHRPEAFDDYVAGEYDLVLSGHAHGGQFRLPLLGGLYAPGQGFLPTYDSGVYTKGVTDLVVSRGIGNSGFPIRFNNRPEVILITLRVDT